MKYQQELSQDSLSCLSHALSGYHMENFKVRMTQLFTPKTRSSVKIWGMALQNVRLCHDTFIFQIWNGSIKWLLRHERLKCDLILKL